MKRKPKYATIALVLAVAAFWAVFGYHYLVGSGKTYELNWRGR